MATTTSEKSKKLSRLFVAMIIIGLVATLFGYFGPLITTSGGSFASGWNLKALKLLNEDLKAQAATEIAENGTTAYTSLKGVGALNFFAKAVFILGIVTLVWFILLCVLYIENPELIYIVIGGLTVLSSLLTFIFTLVLIPSFKQNLIASYASVGYEITSSVRFALGGICLPIGGLLFGGGTAGMALTTPKVEVLHKG